MGCLTAEDVTKSNGLQREKVMVPELVPGVMEKAAELRKQRDSVRVAAANKGARAVVLAEDDEAKVLIDEVAALAARADAIDKEIEQLLDEYIWVRQLDVDEHKAYLKECYEDGKDGKMTPKSDKDADTAMTLLTAVDDDWKPVFTKERLSKLSSVVQLRIAVAAAELNSGESGKN